MADITLEQGEQVPGSTQVRWKDMGDGTYALVFSAAMIVDGDIIDSTNPMPVENIIAGLAVAAGNPFPTVLYDSSGNAVTIDEIIRALTTITTAHHEIHEGDTFSAGYIVPHASPVANDASVDVIITTTTKECHLIAAGAFGGDYEGYLYESPAFSDGTPVTPQNHRRSSETLSTATVVHSPTVTDVGAVLEPAFIPGGTGGNSIGSVGEQRNEWVLKISTSYLLRLTNRAGTAQQASLGASWYEESV